MTFNKRAFSIAEALITLMIVSLILAAVIPVMSRRQLTTDSMWRYVSSGTGANSNIYYGLGTAQTAIIGQDILPLGSSGSRLAIVTPLAPAVGDNDTIKRSLIDFFQKTATGVVRIGRISFDSTGNTAIGTETLLKNTTGQMNTAFGDESLVDNTTGQMNVAIGRASLFKNTTGTANTANGHGALFFNTTGSNNTGIGANAIAGFTAARWISGPDHTGTENTAIGFGAMQANTTGFANVAVGNIAMTANTAGDRNTSIGHRSMQKNTSGFWNSVVGHAALDEILTGSNNSGIGVAVMRNVSSGSNNVAMGTDACSAITTGGGNVCLGYTAGPTANQNNKLYIDNNANDSNSLIYGDFENRSLRINMPTGLGYVSFGNESGYPDFSFTGGSDSSFYINNIGAASGFTSITNKNAQLFTVYNSGAATWSAGGYTSDKRWKKNITPLKSSLEKVLELQGVNYYWKKKEFPKMAFNDKKQIGLIAQEVEKIYPELVINEQGYKYVDYGKITPILIEAVKELHTKIVGILIKISNLEKNYKLNSEKISKLEKENLELKTQLAQINKRLNKIEHKK